MRVSAKTRPITRSLHALVVLCGACGAEPARPWAGTIRDSAGIRLVSNPAEGLWSTRDRPEAHVRLRIGVSEGDSRYQLGDVIAIAVRGDGHLFTLDRQAQAVQEFDRAGTWIRTIGRPGRGPGELSDGVDGLWLGPSDTLIVADVGAQRVTRYDPSGEPAGGFPIPFARGIAYQWHADATGRAVHALVVFGDRGATALLVVARDASGAITDTLLRLPMLEAMTMSASGPALTMLGPEAQWDLGADGALVAGVTDAFRISRYDPAGRLILQFTYPVEPRPVPAADQEAYREALLRLWAGRTPPRMHAVLRQNARFHPTAPVFADLRAGPDATTWVQRFQHTGDLPASERAVLDAERDLGAATWDVFDSAGRYLGPVEFPPRFTPLLFRGTEVFGVLRDSLDVQTVVGLDLSGFGS